ncbi:Galactoside 2-alpha-L-fucosyltransferase [Triticum urartu]|uniref:Fucosyltransferase n=1 Tax=Triticum urartu TaxID=4572 RepID=M7Z506_TRIUA|nr:Galactoside 2-alpha-L-fucosyltransferase [Triticum urartu]
MRRAWPAVCVVAATLLAVVVLSAARDGYGLPMVPSSWLSVEDVPPSNLTTDQLLDGLLTAEFGSRSCRSRYEFASYHDKKKKKKKKKHTSHKPSPYLLAKLRSHEALQKQCGPGTAPYRAAIRQLKSGNGIVTADSENCRYLVPISYRGLGNRMLSTVSAFLYAVLTERTLLVQHDMAALFCEPFPRTTWLLPSSGWLGGGFPLGHLKKYGKDSKESLGNMLKANVLSVGDNGNASWSDSDRPPYVYLHLDGGYGFYDKLFYCDEQQRLIRGAPWLLMRTDSYLVPGLFLIPSFRDELERMFPEKDVAFHHLGRYLFHPANDVWRAVTRYYDAHLAGAGQRVGIQIRVFTQNKPLQKVLDQGLGGILPWIMPATPIWSTETGVVPDPPCMRAMSVEPCFHSPSNYGCAARKDVDVGTLVPYIRHCEDASWGIKIANESMQPLVA